MTYRRCFRVSLALLATVVAGSSCDRVGKSPVAPAGGPLASLTETTLELVVRLEPIADQVAEASIGPDGGTLSLPGGHSLEFPAGALAQLTLIQAVSDGSVVKVDFGPDGLVFPDSALPLITFSYADGTGLTDADAADLRVVYVGESGAVEEVLQTEADTTADVVRARVRHFSTYAIATN